MLLISIGVVISQGLTQEKSTELIVMDIDSNVYHTITIGKQVWMVENLKTTKYRNGDNIPNVLVDTIWSKLKTGAYCNFGNNSDNAKTYGRLYNWYAINDNRKIAPDGWHIPTDAEWTELINYSGGKNIAGGKLKETDTEHWKSPNTGATNVTGFTALPGGARFGDGKFSDFLGNTFGRYAYFWSSTESKTFTTAWYCVLSHDQSNVYKAVLYRQSGFSVRCLKD